MGSESVTFAAMGTECRVEVVTRHRREPAPLLREARRLVAEAEQRWSRFIPTSEVSRINEAGGSPVVVSRETCGLLAAANAGFVGTGGRFSPFVGRTMAAIGYGASRIASDGTFITESRPSSRDSGGVGVPLAMSPIAVDRVRRLVTLEPDVALDLGGIAKGYTADLVLAYLRSKGVVGACVDLGGDIAVWSGDGQPWEVDIADPGGSGGAVATAGFVSGGIATSSTLRRAWVDADGTPSHHLIDPVTGRSASGDVVAVTVAADSAANAEILTKDLLLRSPDDAVARAQSLGLDALIVSSAPPCLVARGVGCWSVDASVSADGAFLLVSSGAPS